MRILLIGFTFLFAPLHAETSPPSISGTSSVICPPCDDVKHKRPEFGGRWIRVSGGESWFGTKFTFGKKEILAGMGIESTPCLAGGSMYVCVGRKSLVEKKVSLENGILSFPSAYDEGPIQFVKAADCSKAMSVTASSDLEALLEDGPFEYNWAGQGASDCSGYGRFEFLEDGSFKVTQDSGCGEDGLGGQHTKDTGRFFYDGKRFIYLCVKGGSSMVLSFDGKYFQYGSEQWKRRNIQFGE